MKKIYILSLLLVTAKLSHGQDNVFIPRTYFGIKGGITKSSVKGNEIEALEGHKIDYQPHIDDTYGFVLSTDLNKSLQLKIEAISTGKGTTYSSPEFEHENEDTNKKTVTYVQVPVLVGYKLPLKSNIKFIVEAGIAGNVAMESVKYNPEAYAPGTDVEAPNLMVSPTAGVEFGYTFNTSYNHSYFFVNFRHDFDHQKYFQRMNGKYYLQHAGMNALTLGVMLRTNKGYLKQQQFN
ncbi:outer membrane beta-barrel protein [Sabulibacter ruber]|uniref:outer membrane beta-barrel protein n=1 Tax=Sabulibacter ruber TaxID=2811901 RepID=UPI001A96C70D|nr:outer membrane beta-barrel protein [Sabulibacter ruber]